MGDTGKKVSIAGFALGVIANLVWFVGVIAGNGLLSDTSGISSFTNSAYSVLMVIALLVIAGGYALKFFSDREILDAVVAGLTALAFLERLMSLAGIPITFGSMIAQIIAQAVINLFMLVIAFKAIKAGNAIFALLMAAAYLFFTVVPPLVNYSEFFYSATNSLISLYFILIGIVELGFYGIAAISIIKEN